MDFSETLRDAIFRANPCYQLVPFDKLSRADQQSALANGLHPTSYGVFLPAAGSTLNIRTACAESALLFLSLQSPAQMPKYVRAQNPSNWIDEVKKLLLDEILEVQIDNAYVCGSALLANNESTALSAQSDNGNLLSSLSAQAILYADKLDISDPRTLSGRIYCFNRRPFCFDQHHGLCDRNKVTAFLRLAELENELALNTRWKQQSQSPLFGGWLNFNSTNPFKNEPSRDKWTCKLYISAHWQHLPQVLLRFLSNTKSHLCACGFKVPCDIFGLLRPDNFVVYVKSKEAVFELADSLAPTLQGTPVQGVPFSSPLTQDGLLSWGADPPKASAFSMVGESWRYWLTNRLASNLIRAKSSDANSRPHTLALERLRLEGIDVDSWTPPQDLL